MSERVAGYVVILGVIGIAIGLYFPLFGPPREPIRIPKHLQNFVASIIGSAAALALIAAGVYAAIVTGMPAWAIVIFLLFSGNALRKFLEQMWATVSED
jgi:hypothetical protein